MVIVGKIVGVGLGLVFGGGPVGALLGGALGHAIDTYVDWAERQRFDPANPAAPRPDAAAYQRQFERNDDGDPTRRYGFTIAVITLGAKMAKVDGRVSREEVRAFREVFRVAPGDVQMVGRVFNQARREVAGYELYAKQLAELLADKPQVRREVLHCLFHIAAADGPLIPTELAFLRSVARILQVGTAEFARLLDRYMPAEREVAAPAAPSDPWALLGLTPAMSDADIKSAYRALVRQTHPDALSARGASQAEMAEASAKLAQINVAYDRIAAERGLR